MEEIQYVGEQLWPQYVGHAAVVMSFVAALLAGVAYFFANQRRDTAEYGNWRNIGRGAFFAHGIGLFTLIGIVFYVMIRQRFEYQYVWAHVSEELPLKYIFSAFWEGQEGSFMLWLFWHVVLGLVLMRTAKEWESPVLSVLSLIQVFVLSMILGIYLGFGDEPAKLGSNPLMLLRETMDAPIFRQADYLELIKGNGLNPLLQNYWMTIHPPTLFLGFASTAVPFTFAIAGLWRGEHKAWLRPALPWALFSGAILGTGILMGGAWAYEALSFGGYWAWDPVENMSLVPWLVLIAGIHANLIARNTGYSIRSTYVFYLLTFVLIVYSTFLTRSGVLGDTSVHAFTEMGLEWQLVAFIVAFLGLSAGLLAVRYRGIPAPKKEESISSKEFWMFIGTLVLLFSALIITASTSLPVYNKIMAFFRPGFEGRVITDAIPHYNKYQIWIAVFIGLLSGGAQFLRFREHNFAAFARRFGLHLGIAAVIALGLSFLAGRWIDLYSWQYSVLLFAGLFTLVSNADYLITFLRGNLKVGGSTLSHMGFGIMIVGILASGLNKHYISSNPFLMEGMLRGAGDDAMKRNILLFKNSPMVMGDYEVTYLRDTLVDYTRTFTVHYKRRNAEGKVMEEFDLHPNVLYDKSFTKIAASNPSTKHYLDHDVFTHIAILPEIEINLELRQAREDSLNYRPVNLALRQPVTVVDTVPVTDQDTFTVRTYQLTLEGISRDPSHPDYHPEARDLALGATVAVHRDDNDSTFYVQPVIALRDQMLYQYPVQINELSAKVRLNEEVFRQFFLPEEDLNYQEFSMKQGETIDIDGYRIQFAGFDKEPRHPHYQAEEGDIVVGGLFNVLGPDGSTATAEPVYLIRGNRPFNIKDQIDEAGLHFRFIRLDPATESIQILIAHADTGRLSVPVDLATDSLRSDYIVLEAIVFPGINLFWLGSSVMMLGLALAMWHRLQSRRSTVLEA